jgi:hypothetical protein
MTQEAFAAAFVPWHDFYLAAASATAALLGLLFVGVSINLSALAAEERVDLRARAGTAFANLVGQLVWVVFVLLVGAADVAWEMLVRVSQERDSS